MKRCSRCGIPKDADDFNRSRSARDGRQNYCRSCISTYGKDWYQKPEKKMHVQARMRQNLYGVDEETYQTMLREQDGKCAICGRVMERPEVDHCHTSGRVRGLLCGSCNKGLGLFGDTEDGVQRALAYLTGQK